MGLIVSPDDRFIVPIFHKYARGVIFKIVSYISIIFGSNISKILAFDPKMMMIDPKMMMIDPNMMMIGKNMMIDPNMMMIDLNMMTIDPT